MKRLLNNLYVTSEKTYLSKQGEAILAKVDGARKLRVPIHGLQGIICFGGVAVSPDLMGFCSRNGVGVSFLSHSGRFLCRVQGPVSGNVLLRMAQYRFADDPVVSTQIAKSVIVGKIANTQAVLSRALRQGKGSSPALRALADAVKRLSVSLTTLRRIDADRASIRGLEGEVARVYFGVFGSLILQEGFSFSKRSRRPPLDPVNALLSFLYTLLRQDVSSALEGVGLDPQVGFLHTVRPGRPSLALDLMEEFRAYVADRLVLSLLNRKQVKAAGFKKRETGAVRMDKRTRRIVISAYQARKKDTIKHPVLGTKVEIGLLPHIQALLLARHLRGDVDDYLPFLVR